MMHLFRKEPFNPSLYDLELKVQAQQNQIDDLRKMILELSSQINALTMEVNYLTQNKYGKGL